MPRRPRNIVLLFGGRSEEHSVSLSSARTLITTFEKLPYQLWPIAVTTRGEWYLVDPQTAFLPQGNQFVLNPASLTTPAAIVPRSPHAQLIELTAAEVLCPELDAVFPIIHGRDGEDGAIQGLAQLCDIPCCGSPLSGSALSMDKLLTKKILQQHRLPVIPFRSLHRSQTPPEWNECQARLGGGKLFVKPACQGSSVGVSRVSQQDEWLPALRHAWQYDDTILVEQAIEGRELEFALLQHQGELQVSLPGEIVITDGSFYDYRHKYIDSARVRLSCGIMLPDALLQAMRHTAREAFRALGLSGFARADFFLPPDGRFVVNEFNSLPGFTQTSMFPLLCQRQGISLTDVVKSIVEHALST